MMLNRRYSAFLIVAIATILFLVGCSSFSATPDPMKKAFEIAHDACGMFRRMGIEQVNNTEAVLKTGGDSTVSKHWVVRLTGTWQAVGTSDQTTETPNLSASSVSPAEWLIACEVSIDANDWHVIATRQTRTKTSP